MAKSWSLKEGSEANSSSNKVETRTKGKKLGIKTYERVFDLWPKLSTSEL